MNAQILVTCNNSADSLILQQEFLWDVSVAWEKFADDQVECTASIFKSKRR
jgi:hypothetical protein